MIELSYDDWYINCKNLPSEDSADYEDFWKKQEKICKEGCIVGGVFINPYLYWHLNFWKADVDYLDDNGKIQQGYLPPLLRDNEWVIFNAIWDAEKGDGNGQKGLALGGIRRGAKSVIEASYISHGATFDEGSQNIIAGLNSSDIKLITDKIDKGLNHLPPYFQWLKLEDNWKVGVTLGVKSRDGKKFPFSQILIRNLDNGNNEEAIAGTKPRKLVIDEAAKDKFVKALQAAMPGFTTPFGWTCSPLICFTGGDALKFHDAKELFMNPHAYNFLAFPHKEKPNVEHGLFIDATYRLEGKVESTLADYLGQPENEELRKIPMQVSDPEKALRITNEIIEQRRLSGDTESYLKEVMYYPINVEDIFVSSSTNFFNKEAIKRQIQLIEDKNITGTFVELYHDGEAIKWKHSKKKPITEYPTPRKCETDAPIVIWEFPVTDSKWALYVCGVDSYVKDGKTTHSDSLGAVYIYKRIHNITGDGYQDMLVASYVARPEDKSYWQDQARLLIKYYNALTLVENDELSFIDYMKQKNDAERYLSPQLEWIKAATPYGTQKARFGISRASNSVQNHLENITKDYLDEVIHQERDKEGSVVNEVLGISRIYDKTLLQELLVYERGRNADRYVAFSLCLALARDLDPVMSPEKKKETDSRVSTIYSNKNKSNTLFGRKVKNSLTKKPKLRI